MSPIRMLRCCVGLLVLHLAGCATSVAHLPQPMVRPNGVPADRIVLGSREKVADFTRTTLAELNVLHATVREGAGIRFECRTAGNARFCFVLVDATVNKNEPRTRIHVGWEHDAQPEDGLRDPIVATILDRIGVKTVERPPENGPWYNVLTAGLAHPLPIPIPAETTQGTASK